MLAEGKLQVDAGGCAIWVSPGVFTTQPGVDEPIQCRPRLYGLGLGLPPGLGLPFLLRNHYSTRVRATAPARPASTTATS